MGAPLKCDKIDLIAYLLSIVYTRQIHENQLIK
jgi:hypothetical protein